MTCQYMAQQVLSPAHRRWLISDSQALRPRSRFSVPLTHRPAALTAASASSPAQRAALVMAVLGFFVLASDGGIVKT